MKVMNFINWDRRYMKYIYTNIIVFIQAQYTNLIITGYSYLLHR